MASAYFPAYEHAKTILDTGNDIDDQLWAKLVKCRILDMKKEVQTRTIRQMVGSSINIIFRLRSMKSLLHRIHTVSHRQLN
jgi:Arc/MetJ family transcription regulator